jgi:aspartyl-tRNA(Asn)/glutamyl-tRNA(Gln) amidotransferase subunit A
MELHELSVAKAAELIRDGEVSPVDLVQALLRRIELLDTGVKAWETLDREGALAAARSCEARVGKGELPPLHGVPVGVKDIFYTAGLRTSSGSPNYRDFVPTFDATSVARLRRDGAVVLGKTVTVQFAHFDPPVTRNPWNQARTPGGSSSGSAAAVAARMIPAALGSQTGGSVLRPAAYCGVVGLKPTYGRISRYGVIPNTWTLDHVGTITRTVEDAALLLQSMAGHDPLDAASSRQPTSDYVAAARRKDRAPRLGFVVDEEQRAQPEIAAHVKETADIFARAGAEIREVRTPRPMSELLAIRGIMCEVEASDLHAHLLKEKPEGYAPRIRELVEVGQLVPAVAYIHAQRLRRRYRPEMEEMLEGLDCLLMPTTSDVAPDPSTTGENWYQGVWSLFGFPSISLPSGLSRERLPLAVQLVALPFREDILLSAAAWAEATLAPMPSPMP